MICVNVWFLLAFLPGNEDSLCFRDAVTNYLRLLWLWKTRIYFLLSQDSREWHRLLFAFFFIVQMEVLLASVQRMLLYFHHSVPSFQVGIASLLYLVSQFFSGVWNTKQYSSKTVLNSEFNLFMMLVYLLHFFVTACILYYHLLCSLRL